MSEDTHMNQTFSLFDLNRDGSIDIDDLKQVRFQNHDVRGRRVREKHTKKSHHIVRSINR